VATIEQLEERLAALERELAEVKRLFRLAGRANPLTAGAQGPKLSPEDYEEFNQLCRDFRNSVCDPGEESWAHRIAGELEDDPEFDEVIRLGREWRESFRPEPEQQDSD
jgi:hypothetical protein